MNGYFAVPLSERNQETVHHIGKYHDICNIELGMRHHDIFHRFPEEMNEREQGFYTSKGRYVDRKEGAEIAYAAGQIDSPVDKLFSEDLY